jgi:hypothetical protein
LIRLFKILLIVEAHGLLVVMFKPIEIAILIRAIEFRKQRVEQAKRFETPNAMAAREIPVRKE